MVQHRATALCSALAATVVCVIAWCTTRTTSQLPENLEPVNGAAQCNYELLHAFTRYIDRSGVRLRYSIGAGTLLGAMRNQPPGLLQWEHDVDVYMPARDAFELLGLLANECCSAGDKCSRDVRACGQGVWGGASELAHVERSNTEGWCSATVHHAVALASSSSTVRATHVSSMFW